MDNTIIKANMYILALVLAFSVRLNIVTYLFFIKLIDGKTTDVLVK